MAAACMHDQDFGSLVRLLDHVRQMMAVVFGERGTENHQVKGVALECVLKCVSSDGRADMMAGLLHFGGLSGKYFLVGLSVKNFDRVLGRSGGQRGSP